MNFEVNGIPYLLTFDANASQWCLLTPSRHGIEALEIHDDGGLLTTEVPAAGSGNARKVVN